MNKIDTFIETTCNALKDKKQLTYEQYQKCKNVIDGIPQESISLESSPLYELMNETPKKESLYDTFYPKEVKSVRLIFLYINDKNELIYSKKFKYPVSKSIIHKNKFLNLLKKNIVYNNRKFFPESMIQFNMTLNPADINVFIDEPNKFNFFKPVNYMREIRWDETIEFFQSLRNIYFLYQ